MTDDSDLILDEKPPALPTREDYYNVMLDACSLEDFREIVRQAVRDARMGDWRARNFVTAYLIGPPIQIQQILIQGRQDHHIVVKWEEEPPKRLLPEGDEYDIIEAEVGDDRSRAAEKTAPKAAAIPGK